MPTKDFIFTVTVSRSYRKAAPKEAAAHARSMLNILSDEERPLRGPRGGMYLPIGNPDRFEDGQTDEDFMHGTWTYTARQKAKYVRPKRKH